MTFFDLLLAKVCYYTSSRVKAIDLILTLVTQCAKGSVWQLCAHDTNAKLAGVL